MTSPEMVLDLLNPENCVYILNAKPNETSYPTICCKSSLLRNAKTAAGKRAPDGLSFSIEIMAGRQAATHVWNWDLLTETINSLRNSWDRRGKKRG